MNESMSLFLLLSVPGLPLLLAFPAVRSYLPRPCFFALLPVIILLALPVTISIKIPWLLLGTGFGFDEVSRMLLALSVLLWIGSAALLYAASDYSSDDNIITYFMLTLSGNLGAILASDVMTFFVFSTLITYAFYALLSSGEGESVRQSGRVYLGFMIVADLLLFEALFIAAIVTKDLGFIAVHDAMAHSSSLELYLLMVFIGFGIKAGFWPLHFWLKMVFCLSRPAVAILSGGVPIAMGLLGMIRWLPLGEITSSELAIIVQSIGGMAMLYAIIMGLLRTQLRMLLVYAVIFCTGLFSLTMGAALSDPAVWVQYGELVYIFIAFFGIAFAVFAMALWQWESKYACPVIPLKQSDFLSLCFGQYRPVVFNFVRSQMKLDALYQISAKLDFLWQKRLWNRILKYCELSLQHWTLAITLFLLLTIIIALIGGLSDFT